MLIYMDCEILNLFVLALFGILRFLLSRLANFIDELLIVQVIANMRVMMTEDSNNAVSSSFLLDDDSRLVCSAF